LVPGVFELDMHRGGSNVPRLPRDLGLHYRRRAA
jgi:hypothetical protein